MTSRYVAIQGAAELIMRCCLFCVSLRDSYPPNSMRVCLVLLVNRVNLFRILLLMILLHDIQISPDKNVSFPCTNAAFTLPPEPMGFVRVVPTRPRAKPFMRFLSVVSHVCTPASFRPFLAESPLPSARTFGSIHTYEHLSVLVQGTFTP